ncbi:hypothetical protein AVEN_90682-1, partial [Araneus ventricosus]
LVILTPFWSSHEVIWDGPHFEPQSDWRTTPEWHPSPNFTPRQQETFSHYDDLVQRAIQDGSSVNKSHPGSTPMLVKSYKWVKRLLPVEVRKRKS